MIRYSRELQTAALTGMLFGAMGCMETDRVIAVQLDAFPPFSSPTLVTGLRGDTIDVHDPSLTGDELEIYLSSDTNGVSDIWTSTRTASDSAWNPAVMQSDLSSSGNDVDPDVSPGGLVIYFSSDRAGAGYQLYVSRRTARDQPWDPPQQMAGLGSSTLDMGPTVDRHRVDHGLRFPTKHVQRQPLRSFPHGSAGNLESGDPLV